MPVTDLYCAKEHPHGLARLDFPVTTDDFRKWLTACLAKIDRDNIDKLLGTARHRRGPDPHMEVVEKVQGYFGANRQRTRYSHFRGLGVAVGSGAVQPGCRTLVAQRMRLSGLPCGARGAPVIIISPRAQESTGPTSLEEI